VVRIEYVKPEAKRSIDPIGQPELRERFKITLQITNKDERPMFGVHIPFDQGNDERKWHIRPEQIEVTLVFPDDEKKEPWKVENDHKKRTIGRELKGITLRSSIHWEPSVGYCSASPIYQDETVQIALQLNIQMESEFDLPSQPLRVRYAHLFDSASLEKPESFLTDFYIVL